LEGIAWLGGIDVGNVTGMEGSGKYKESMRWYERIIVQKLEIYYYADSIHIKA